MTEEKNTLRRIGLQFFADDGDEGGGQEGQEGSEGAGGTGGESGKTFTQEDVNRLLKSEKESAKKSLLKELGMEDVKTAKEGLAKYKEILDKDKSEAELAKEKAGLESKARDDAEKRALLAEAKVEVLSAGCNPKYLEDLIVLAMRRVSEEKDLATVVKEMKAEEKYAAFFENDGTGSGDQGTGGGAGFRRGAGGDKAGTLGSRLAGQANAGQAKNPYFNN